MLQQQLIRLKKVFVRSNSQFVLTSKKGYFESRKASKKFYVMCVACRSIKQKFYFQQKKHSSNSVNLVIFVDDFQNIACTTIYQNIKKRDMILRPPYFFYYFLTASKIEKLYYNMWSRDLP